MMRVIDMETGSDAGKPLIDEFGQFADEVLGAQWTPLQQALELGLQPVAEPIAEPRKRRLFPLLFRKP